MIECQPVTAVWRNGGCSASYDSFVVGSSAVLRLNFYAKNRHYAKPQTVRCHCKKTRQMNQTRFSQTIELFLRVNYSEFIPTLKYQDDGSFDCELRNLSNEFSIWLATYNSEITIGLIAPDGSTDIHTHISCYDEEDLNDSLSDLATKINEIIQDKLILYYSDRTGYDWTYDIDSVFKKQNASNDIRAYSWKERETRY